MMGTANPQRDPASRVLDVARAMVDARRFDVSVRAIARDADVAVGTLYEHFASRDGVFEGVALAELDDEADALAEVLAAHPDAPLADLVHALTRRLAARAAGRAPTILGLLALPGTHARVSPRGGLRAPATAHIARALSLRGEALHPSLTPTQCAELAAVTLRGALLGALEERPQYLHDPAFVACLAALTLAAIARAPEPLPTAPAMSHAHRFRRAASKTVAPRKLPAQRRSRALFDAIVLGTERVVERVGLQGVTTPRVAETAGVSVGSLYQYFGDRRALLAALVDRWIAHDLAFVDETLARLAPLPFAAAFERGLLDAHERVRTFAKVYRAIYALLPQVERYEAAQDFLAHARELVARRFAARDDAVGRDLELVVFVLGHAWVAWNRALLTDRRSFFEGEAFASSLRRVAGAASAPSGGSTP